jgi:hypothetical protein
MAAATGEMAASGKTMPTIFRSCTYQFLRIERYRHDAISGGLRPGETRFAPLRRYAVQGTDSYV